MKEQKISSEHPKIKVLEIVERVLEDKTCIIFIECVLNPVEILG